MALTPKRRLQLEEELNKKIREFFLKEASELGETFIGTVLVSGLLGVSNFTFCGGAVPCKKEASVLSDELVESMKNLNRFLAENSTPCLES